MEALLGCCSGTSLVSISRFCEPSHCGEQLPPLQRQSSRRGSQGFRVRCASKPSSSGGSREESSKPARGAKRGRGRKPDPLLEDTPWDPPNLVYVGKHPDWISRNSAILITQLTDHYTNSYRACLEVGKTSKEYWMANLGQDEKFKYLMHRALIAVTEKETVGVEPKWDMLYSDLDIVEGLMETEEENRRREAGEENDEVQEERELRDGEKLFPPPEL